MIGDFYLDQVAEDTTLDICKKYNLSYDMIIAYVDCFFNGDRQIHLSIDFTNVCNHTLTQTCLKLITENGYKDMIWRIVGPKVEEMRREQLIIGLADIK